MSESSSVEREGGKAGAGGGEGERDERMRGRLAAGGGSRGIRRESGALPSGRREKNQQCAGFGWGSGDAPAERFTSTKPMARTSIHTMVVRGMLMSKPR